MYGIDWGEEVQKTDLEDIVEQYINVSYQDYKLKKDDYFEGCKTMLTSEKAALAVCHQIQMEQERLCTELNWIDPDWGPKRKSDLERCKKALYKTGEPPNKGFPDPKDV